MFEEILMLLVFLLSGITVEIYLSVMEKDKIDKENSFYRIVICSFFTLIIRVLMTNENMNNLQISYLFENVEAYVKYILVSLVSGVILANIYVLKLNIINKFKK